MIIMIKCEFLYYGLNIRLLQCSAWYFSEIYNGSSNMNLMRHSINMASNMFYMYFIVLIKTRAFEDWKNNVHVAIFKSMSDLKYCDTHFSA